MHRTNDRKGKAIRRQALHGFLIFVIGMAVVFALVPGGDWKTIDQDPTPILPGLGIAMLGALVIVLARIRMVFHRPKTLIHAGKKKLLQNLVESITS